MAAANGSCHANCAHNINNLGQTENCKKSWLDKYGEAMKILIPIRFSKNSCRKDSLPSGTVGMLNYLSLQWMDKYMWHARKGVEKEDVKPMYRTERVEANSERISRLWNEELKSKGPTKASLRRTVWKFCRARLIVSALLMALTCIFQFLGPAWIFAYFLDYLSDDTQPVWIGIVWVVLLSAIQLLRNFCMSAMFVMACHTGVRAQAALQTLIFKKVLAVKINSSGLTAGVLNYFTNDIERIDIMMQQSMFIVGVPVMCILSIAYCYLIIGPWSLLGNAIVLLYYPMMALMAKKTSKQRMQTISLTDKRISLMSEILNSIKLIKMYAWEAVFAERIHEIRQKEEKLLFAADYLQSVSMTNPIIILILAPMTSIIGHVLSGRDLTASMAFSLVTVFPILQIALNTLPMSVRSISEGVISCERIQELLIAEDSQMPDNGGIRDSPNAVSITNADLTWVEVNTGDTLKITARYNRETTKTDKEPVHLHKYTRSNSGIINPGYLDDDNTSTGQQTVVKHLNIDIPKGQLVGICGNVGSGKSTLLAGISGEAILEKGSIRVHGTVALSTQQAWIFNATVRDNIIFGLPFDEERYKMVVDVCCLETDFQLMPNGDQTEIGEKGANLSGGQKQRINLARSVYSDRDVYLLDDTLSAVDVKVGKYIFQNCIKKALHGKTVMLITHAVHVLEQCDCIVVMKNGAILEKGTHEELMELDGDYRQMYECDQEQRSNKKSKNDDETTDKVIKNVQPTDGAGGDDTMIKEEVDTSNRITWPTVIYFAKACGGYFISSCAWIVVIVFGLANVFSSVWLQVWLDAGSGAYRLESSNDTNETISNASIVDYGDVTLNPDLKMYVTVYGASGIIVILCGVIKSLTVIKVLLTGMNNLHKELFWKVLRSPVSFFDTTPFGRIIGRFSKDMDELDVLIPFITDFVVQTIVIVVFRFILVGVNYHIFFIIVAAIIVAYIGMDIFLFGAVRESKRAENILRPPVLVHVSTTIQGLSVIRNFKKEQMFIEKFKQLVDKHLSSYLVYQLSSKWVAFRVDMLCWVTITVTSIVILVTKGQVSTGNAGQALSQLFQICCILAIMTRFKSELEAKLISIERITKYCKKLTSEAPAIIPDNRPPKNWPTTGEIHFDDVQMRYRPETQLVLHGLTVHIKGGEKVGIIGRTGAGKSSVIGCLLRLTEISNGSISIDGVDISKIGLEDLRSNIAVIPQEPVLFQGTIRWNLDPFNVCSDEQIWDALDKTHLKEKISKETKLLETVLSSDGGGFSIGEKQLFCMARALLKKNKILLLDEATASVDVETDKFIQETIRKSFVDSTVLTIAHRLNTIVDYEKILAMDAGRVVEFDSPENLLNTDSLFRSMMKATYEGSDVQK